MAVFLPLRRLASARDDDAGPVLGPAGLDLDGRRQVHRERHRRDDPGGVVHQPDELPQVGLAHEVDDAVQPRMPVARLAALDELDAARGSGRRPAGTATGPTTSPCKSYLPPATMIQKSSRQPIGSSSHLAHPGFLLVGEVDIAAELRHRDPQAQLLLEVPGVAVDEVIGALDCSDGSGRTAWRSSVTDGSASSSGVM